MCKALLILSLDQEHDNNCACACCGRTGAIDAVALAGGHRSRQGVSKGLQWRRSDRKQHVLYIGLYRQRLASCKPARRGDGIGKRSALSIRLHVLYLGAKASLEALLWGSNSHRGDVAQVEAAVTPQGFIDYLVKLWNIREPSFKLGRRNNLPDPSIST